jgi:hypothetical protein
VQRASRSARLPRSPTGRASRCGPTSRSRSTAWRPAAAGDGIDLLVNSAFRSNAEQARLFAAHPIRSGSRAPARRCIASAASSTRAVVRLRVTRPQRRPLSLRPALLVGAVANIAGPAVHHPGGRVSRLAAAIRAPSTCEVAEVGFVVKHCDVRRRDVLGAGGVAVVDLQRANRVGELRLFLRPALRGSPRRELRRRQAGQQGISAKSSCRREQE